ncbi:MAG: helix-turn-helix domain-containing protein [Candidatus Zixiibacteriota bacterium]
MKRILLVGSDPKVSQDLDRHLDAKEFKLLVSPHGKSVLTSLINARPHLVILDLNSLDTSARQLVEKIRELDPGLPLIVIPPSGTDQTRDEISQDRSYELFTSPVSMERLALTVRRMLFAVPKREEQKVLLGSVRLSSDDNMQIGADRDPAKSSENPSSASDDYQQLFERVLNPSFEQIIRDCRGQIYDRLLSELEKTMLSYVLKHVNHNQVKASRLLGISRNTLRERMKRFDIF